MKRSKYHVLPTHISGQICTIAFLLHQLMQLTNNKLLSKLFLSHEIAAKVVLKNNKNLTAIIPWVYNA